MTISSASESTLQGQAFHRVLQEIPIFGSRIDIYEIDVGARAIAVGPESDFSAYQVYYYDPLADGDVQRFRLTPEQPFVAELFARNGARFPTTGAGTNPQLAGKMLVTPDEILPSTRALLQIDPLAVNVFRPPMVDVLAFTSAPIQLPSKRPAKRYRQVIELNPGSNNYYFPTYGRRKISAFVLNGSGIATALDVRIFFVKFIYPVPLNTVLAEQTVIQTALNVVAVNAVGASGTVVGATYNADDSAAVALGSAGPLGGSQDYIRFNISAGAASPTDTNPTGGVQLLLDVAD